jgi:hypothetical protein
MEAITAVSSARNHLSLNINDTDSNGNWSNWIYRWCGDPFRLSLHTSSSSSIRSVTRFKSLSPSAISTEMSYITPPACSIITSMVCPTVGQRPTTFGVTTSSWTSRGSCYLLVRPLTLIIPSNRCADSLYPDYLLKSVGAISHAFKSFDEIAGSRKTQWSNIDGGLRI